MEKNTKNRLFKWGIWFAVGVTFGLVLAFMVVSGSKSLNQFYDGGKVYDVLAAYRNGDAWGMTYDGNIGALQVTESKAAKICYLSDTEAEWDYSIFELSKLNKENIPCVFDYVDVDGESVYYQNVLLTEGENMIQTDGIAYAGVNIWFYDQVGTTVSFDKIQFREKMVNFELGKFLGAFAAAFVLYAVITVLFCQLAKRYGKKKNDWYYIIDFLQGFYILVGERMGRITQHISAKNRGRLRIGLFLFLIIYMQIVLDLHMYETNRYYKIQMLVCSVAVVAISALCREKELVRINWRNKLVGAWTTLWIMACVSDFFVEKRYSFSGYIMLFVIGFFCFMWNNMEQKETIIHEFIVAIIISFVITTIFCFMCRPWVEGTRYLGSYYRPGMYGMYILYVWIAILGHIDYIIHHNKKLLPLILPETAGLALAAMLLWKTQASSGVLPAALVAGIFVFKQLFFPGDRSVRKKAFMVIMTTIVIAVPVCEIGEWGLKNIPGIFDTEVYIEDDEVFTAAQIQTPFSPVTVYAAENEGKSSGSRILKKLFEDNSLEAFTSARNFYWAGYLREMNLLGNENKVVLWGENRWPHSGFIAMMYRYGVFAVIPYTIMLFVNLLYAWKYMLRNGKNYGFFIFAVMAAAFVLILMENLELPFLYLCWWSMYLMMGVYFEQEETEQRICHEE